MKANNPAFDVFRLCQEAGEKLISYGFRRKVISLKTEACYYFLPGREGVLRVAAHKSKPRWNGLDNVVARLTFSGNGHRGDQWLICSPEKLETMLHIAIGQYIAKSTLAVAASGKNPGSDRGCPIQQIDCTKEMVL